MSDWVLRSFPEGDSACKTVPIVALVDDTVAVDAELECSCNGRQRIDLDVARGRIDVGDLSLTVERVQAVLAVIL